MSKRPDRPWECLPPDASSQQQNCGNSLEAQLAQARAVLEAPSVWVDRIQYWSDRFYLNHVDSDPLPSKSNSSGCCTCGSNQPPPLLSRERLLKNLDLKACILGTYTLDTAWLVEAFPRLVGPHATVPTLILHGSKKTFKEQQMMAAEEPDDDEDSASEKSTSYYESPEQENSQPSVPSHCKKGEAPSITNRSKNFPISLVDFALSQQSKDGSSSTKGSSSLRSHQSRATERTSTTTYPQTKNDTRRLPVAATENEDGHPVPPDVFTSPSTVTPEGGASSSSEHIHDLLLGKLCSTSYVLSAWQKPNKTTNVGVSYETSMTTENGGSTIPECNSELKRGVHHPKFMILFETSGDVLVLVSTANLTKTRTIEGTWVQRFHPNRRYQEQQKRARQQQQLTSVSSARKHTPPSPSSASKRNDFGLVLQDFLEKLDAATIVGDTKIHDFLCNHLGFPLMELAQSFFFEKAQVHLVPVVPGDWEDVDTSKKATLKPPLPFSYGRQRVRDILQKENVLQSNNDRLIVQPTSFGGNWTRGQMADMVRTYLNVSQHGGGGEGDSIDYWDEEGLLERMDIVWPSRTYIRNAQRDGHKKPLSMEQVEKAHHDNTRTEASFVFMSSNTFNSCDQSCISRLARFRLSNPPQRPRALVPHFKSICRLVAKQSAIQILGLGSNGSTAQEYLSWFLLTSACLSQGAQGKRVQDTDPLSQKKHKVHYSNFELGVLFTSRMQPKEQRLYTFAPHQCSCQRLTHQKQKLIHLPVPYSLHPKPFLNEGYDSAMQETPFFHEIEVGTRCVGNMLLTPFGIQEAKKQRIRSKKNDS